MLGRVLRLVKDSLIYGGGSLLNQLIGFLLLPLYTRLLTPADYGVASMLALLPIVFVTLATSGMKSAVYQRFNKCADERERTRMISTAQLSVLVSSVVLAALALATTPLLSRLLFGSDMAHLELRLTVLSAVLAALSEIPRAALQSFKKVRETAMLSVAQFFVTTVVTVIAVAVLRLGVLGLVVGGLAGQSLATALSVALSRSSLRPQFSKSDWRSMSAYGRPYLPHRLMGVVLAVFADWVVRERLGLHEAGLYGMASRFAMPVAFLTGALTQAWQPYKYQVLHEESADRAFFASIFTYFVCIFGWLWVGLAALGPEALRLLAAPAFSPAASLIWILVLMRILQGAYPMLATGVDVGDNTRLVPLASLVATATMVPVTLLASAAWGAGGAALGSAVGWLVMSIAFYFISERVFPIPYDLKAVFSVAAFAGACVAATLFIQRFELVPRLICELALCLGFPLVVYAVLASSPSERARIQKLSSSLKARLTQRGLKRPAG